MAKDVFSSFSADNLSRKQAVARLLDAGYDLKNAYSALGEHTGASDVPGVTDEEIAKFSASLQSLASHPSVLADLRNIQSADGEDSKVYMAQQFVEKWKTDSAQKEIDFDSVGFRLALRVFEVPSYQTLGQERTLATTEPNSSSFDDAKITEAASRLTVCGSVGYIVCASVGGELRK